jgi:hypothetical protein
LVSQLPSVTSDNAANNDTMVEHLSTLVDNFPGAPNQTRCFIHILNLVAKSVLRQFNVAKKSGLIELDDASKELALLAQELNLGSANDDNNNGNDGNDSNDSNVGDVGDVGDDDGDNEMSEEELAELEASLVPIQLMLTKVGRFLILHTFFTYCEQLQVLANAIKNSSTILLPHWIAKLEELCLGIQMMPRDISTCWNSMFNMLDFAIKYRTAIDFMTSNCELNLRKCELEDNK